MKRIPYGIMNFKTLIEEDYYYVDKTMYLEKLEKMPDALINLRPGRFGKSLFESMMYYYYDVNSADFFEKLFKETYVYQNPTKGKNNYYILKFDFSGINENQQDEEVIESFKLCIIVGINDFLNRYNINYEYNKDVPVDVMLKKFLSFFQNLKLDYKIYIIIDEYDNFTNAIFEGNIERFKNIIGTEGFIKDFYTTIKENMGTVIGKFYATGICPITLNSITTGLNILNDISTNIEFNNMIGFTHREVKDLLKELVEEKDREEIYNLMVSNYDGYLFNKDASERVFNSTLVMYLLNYYVRFKKAPEELMDNNVAFNSGKIGIIVELQNNNYYQKMINEIMENEKIKGILKQKFDLNLELERNDLISLLYYFGYLTFTNENGNYYFKIPYEAMKVIYGNYFNRKLRKIGLEYDYKKLIEINSELVTGKIEKLSKYVSEILKKLNNRNFIDLNEKSLKMIYFTILINIKCFNVRSNCSSYIDIYLERKKIKIPNNIMIELKYIKKQDYNEKLLNEKIREGKVELKKYSKDKKISNTLKYLVVFIGDDLKIIEEV